MAVKFGELLFDRFFWDVGETGHIYDLSMIFRNVPKENEDGLNDRIDKKNKQLQGRDENPGYFCTLGLRDDQIEALSDRHKKSFSAKTRLMVFRPGAIINDPYEMDIPYWNEQGNDIFLWSNPKKVYCRMDGDGLNYRYPRVTQKVVDEYGASLPTPPIPPAPPAPPMPVSGNWKVTGTVVDGVVDLLVVPA